MTTHIDTTRAVSLVTKLMAIPGKSGEETRILKAVVGELRGAKVPASAMRFDRAHTRSPFGGETGSLIVRLPGTRSGPRRLLMAHVDTVPVCEGCKPVRRGNRIRSADRGTALGADNRSGVAAILSAVRTLRSRKLDHPPLTLFFPIQEEVGLVGSRLVSLRDLGNPKLAFNWDGGAPDELMTAATGAYRMKTTIEGVASHAGVHPEDGVSAIAIASAAIADLDRDGWLGLIEKGTQRGTSNVGTIEGGSACNVVAPHATVLAEVRSHSPRFRETILKRFRRSFERAAASHRNVAGRQGKVRFEIRLDYESFKLKTRDPSVVAAVAAVKAVTGRAAKLKTVNGGLDANWMTRHGLPTVTLGAGQHHPHTVDEVLHIDEFLGGCEVALNLACGEAPPS